MNKTDVILDECYKETLTRVRPYVLSLTSSESAQLCKVWLHKLNAASSQRCLRNEYLLELYRQLKTGHIRGVFSTPPSNGPLLPLPKPHHTVCISSSVSDLSDCDRMKSHRNCLRPTSKCVQYQRGKSLSKYRIIDVKSMNRTANVSPSIHFYNQKLHARNEYLKNQLLESRENYNGKANDYLCASIGQLTADVTTLKAKITEVSKLKNLEETCKETIQEYHYSVVEQFTKLRHQLEEERVKNETLNKSIAAIGEKLEEITHGKDKELKEIERQCINKINVICERFETFIREKDKELQQKQDSFEKKNIELSKKNEGKKEEIETLTNKIYDLEAKLETNIRNEDKLQAMLIEQYATMKQEFKKMKIDIDYENQKQNENLMSKVRILKKAIIKLEKSKQKLEHDYEKKMLYIVKNKDMEIKALQLRLQEQKNELYTTLNKKKQNEMDKAVSSLEEQYRTILAGLEARTEVQTQEYLRKIAMLENEVCDMKKVRLESIEQ